jgi:lipopolysaccharide biosynthesis glycosyltransferase
MSNSERISVAVVCDDNYAQHATVMLRSLLVANARSAFDCFILVPGDFSSRPRIEASLRDLPHGHPVFVAVDPATFKTAKVTGHISLAAYYRLAIGELLPPEIARVIYFDCDVIVKGDIGPIWSVDLGRHAVAATLDPLTVDGETVRRRLGFDDAKPYLNSGVMVIDLARWRARQIGARALAFCLAEPERLTYWDQCAINHVLDGAFKLLDARWNFQSSMLTWDDEFGCTPDSVRAARAAAIVHFTTGAKPWHYRCRHPLVDLYWAHLRPTAWRDYRPPDRTPLNVMRRELSRLPLARAAYRQLKQRFSSARQS